MITCSLRGGLGNQMFQIAATTSLALDNNDESCFNFENCHTPLQGNPSISYKENIFKKICNNNNFKINYSYTEKNFSFSEIPYVSNMNLIGYFQSEKFFIKNKNHILNLFELPYEDVKKPSENITSVHIRRGDYLNLKNYHSLCDIDFYKKSIQLIGEGNFIFFSDDMNWVKENFIGDNFFYSQYDNEILDLSLMSICDNNIISNSSFSWWGAYLNKNKNKKVIAPNQWFGPNGPKDTQDIIPENWIKL